MDSKIRFLNLNLDISPVKVIQTWFFNNVGLKKASLHEWKSTIVDQRNAFVFALSPCIGEERENEFEFSPRWRHAREFLEVRRPGWPKPFSTFVLRWEKPRIGTRTKARHRGESFRNRIATRRGSLKLWGKRPVESERESRLRKRNCSAARRAQRPATFHARLSPPVPGEVKSPDSRTTSFPLFVSKIDVSLLKSKNCELFNQTQRNFYRNLENEIDRGELKYSLNFLFSNENN